MTTRADSFLYLCHTRFKSSYAASLVIQRTIVKSTVQSLKC